MCGLIHTAAFLAIVSAVTASPLALKHQNDFQFDNECTNGDAFYKECNICVCGDNNMITCTTMECDAFGSRTRKTGEIIADYKKDVPRISNYVQGQKCPAASFYNDCNLCVCGSDDVSAACTLILCPSQEPKEEVAISKYQHIDKYSQGQACPAGELFYNNCNLCQCSVNGLSAACTLMVCPSENTRRNVPATEIYNWPHIDDYSHGNPCPANEMFFMQCNLCHCSSDGMSAACTMMLCLPEN